MPTSAKFLAALVLLGSLSGGSAGAQTVPAATITALGDALKDSDAEVRQQAAWALGRIRSEQSADALIAAMRDTDQDVRKQVIWALGRIRSAKAVDALTAALKDSDTEVRRSAAQALAQIYGHGGNFSPNPNPNPNPNPQPRPF
jgi:HEAT repeat protein